MATREQLINALRKADAAGDTQAATVIAKRIKEMSAQQEQIPSQPQPIQQPQTLEQSNMSRLQNISQQSAQPKTLEQKITEPVDIAPQQLTPEINDQVAKKMEENRAAGLFVPRDKVVEELTGTPVPEDTNLTESQKLAKQQGVLDAMLISAGKTFVDLYDVVGEQFGLDPVEDRSQIEKIALKDLENERPISTFIGELLPFLPAGFAAGGLSTTGRKVAASTVLGATEGATVAKGDDSDIATGAGVGAAIAGTLEAAFPKIAKGFKNLKRSFSEDIPDNLKEAFKVADELGTKVTTSDVFAPETKLGKLAQAANESLPIVGSGALRKEQQVARVQLIEEIGKEFGIEDLSDEAAKNILDSVSASNEKLLEKASEKRSSAILALKDSGSVPMDFTIKEIDNQIAFNKAKGLPKNLNTVRELEALKESITDKNFDILASIKSDMGEDVRLFNIDNKTNQAEALEKVEMAVKRDLNNFAKNTDEVAFDNWTQGNKDFVDIFKDTKKTSLSRAIKNEESKPSDVIRLITGGDATALKRLNKFTDKKGKENVKSAIISNALEKAGFFKSAEEINPSAFIRELEKPNMIKAVNEFFPKGSQDRKILDGYRKFLDLTKQAQDAKFLSPTGQQVAAGVPTLAAVQSAFTDLGATAATVGTIGALNKLYGSAPIRNFMVRLNAAKTKTAQDKVFQDFLKKADKIKSGLIPAVNQEINNEEQE